jgi:hypothetical protein
VPYCVLKGWDGAIVHVRGREGNITQAGRSERANVSGFVGYQVSTESANDRIRLYDITQILCFDGKRAVNDRAHVRLQVAGTHSLVVELFVGEGGRGRADQMAGRASGATLE